MDRAGHSPLRFLAPLALLVAVGVVVLVVSTSVGGDEQTGGETGTPAAEERPNRGASGGDAGGAGPATYEVQSGDTLDSISEDTGVSVEQLLELNPDVDPEALSTGQALKLRE